MFLLFPVSACYIDISAVSYAIPLIVGVVIAISSAVYLRVKKVKSKISKTLGIDENAGKEVEDDIVIREEDAEGEPKTDTEAKNPSDNEKKD